MLGDFCRGLLLGGGDCGGIFQVGTATAYIYDVCGDVCRTQRAVVCGKRVSDDLSGDLCGAIHCGCGALLAG